jgi:hypothetical protein
MDGQNENGSSGLAAAGKESGEAAVAAVAAGCERYMCSCTRMIAHRCSCCHRDTQWGEDQLTPLLLLLL